jgi:Cu/Ag efflux protein CusF
MRLLITTCMLLLLAFLVAGCGKKDDQSRQAGQSHHFVGQVMAIDPPSRQITIAHGNIPNFMKAMTMDFVVKDTNLLRGISVGDSVRGVLVVQRPDVWLDSLALISKM